MLSESLQVCLRANYRQNFTKPKFSCHAEMKALHFQFTKQIGVMIITLINIQTSIKLCSKSFSNCLMKHFHTGIHWDIKKWGWYNQQRLESIQYWIMRLWIILILLICFLLAYLLQSIELIRLFAFLLKIMNSQLNLQSFWM